MKKVGAAVVVTMLLFGQAQAWEFKNNPDRFPSIGIHVMNGSVKGDRFETDLPDRPTMSRTQSGPESEMTYTVGADVKVPINQGMTLGFFYNHHEINRTYERNHSQFFNNGEVLLRETSNLNGYQYGFDFRLYMNK